MTIQKSTARTLATKAEWPLIESSHGDALKALTPARLKQKIARARTLQDKYRERARQQRGEARGKRQAKGTRPAQGNDGTRRKQELFTEVRERFEAQLAKLEAAAEREAARAAEREAKAAAAASRKASAKRPRTPWSADEAATIIARRSTSAASRGARKAAARTRQGSTKHQAHVGARGRRRQARRDAK
jgi:hypothetical protein